MEDYNQDTRDCYNLREDLGAEEPQQKHHNQQRPSSSLSSSSLSSGRGRSGGSDKENRTPTPSMDAAAAVTAAAAATANAAAPSSNGTNPIVGGKKFFVSKKSLALDGQWAMVGDGGGDQGTESSDNVSNCSDLSSTHGSSSAGTAFSEDVVTDGDEGGVTGAAGFAGVQQDPGELLSTGVSFLDDASFFDSSVEKASLNITWKGESSNVHNTLSPVAEDTGDGNDIAVTGTPATNANGDLLSQSVYTFTPGSTADDCGALSPTSNVTVFNITDTSPSNGIFNDVEWNKNTDESSNEGETSPLKDASMWVLPPKKDSSDETLSNAPFDEVDESIGTTSRVSGKRKAFEELSISPEDSGDIEVDDDDNGDDEENERVASLTPNRCLRLLAIDQALEETTLYMSKIQDLESALHNAQRKAENEAKRRRDCEKRIDELLDASACRQNDNAITRLPRMNNNDLLNESALVSPQEDSAREHDFSSGSSELLDVRAATASLMERNQTLVKEIRFADQTCVELSERNAALQRDVDQYSKLLEAANTEKTSLQEQLIESTKDVAKLIEREATYSNKISDQKRLYKAQIGTVETELTSARMQISALEAALKESEKEKSALVADIAAAKTKANQNLEQLFYTALNKPVSTVETDLANARLQISTLESALKETEEKKSALIFDLAAAEDKVADVTTEAEVSKIDFEKQCKQSKKECDTLRLKCSELEAQVELLSKGCKEDLSSK